MNQLFGNQGRIAGLPASGTTPGMRGFLQDYFARYMATWQGLDSLWTYTSTTLPWLHTLARESR